MKTSYKDRRRWLSYCETELTRTSLNPERRKVLEAKRDFYAAQLVDRCARCGIKLEDPESKRLGFGRECATKVDPSLLLSRVEQQEQDADAGAVDDVVGTVADRMLALSLPADRFNGGAA